MKSAGDLRVVAIADQSRVDEVAFELAFNVHVTGARRGAKAQIAVSEGCSI
jgi:hypothetical protein